MSTRSTKASIIKYYLLAYNITSGLLWAYILVTLTAHLASAEVYPHKPTASTKASNVFTRYLSSIPYIKSTYLAPSNTAQVEAYLHPLLVPIFKRASTAFDAVGEQTVWIQTLAILEIVHSLLGLVKSPVVTTVMQVFSRLVLVWGIAERYEVARTNPLYASMVLAWSITEVIRYSFYAFSVVSKPPYFLVWLRYTTFYVLYPVGAGSEAFLIYSTLPSTSPYPASTFKALVSGIWTFGDYIRGAMFIIWWPALYSLMTYMMSQRRKALGGSSAKKLGKRKVQ